MRRLYLPCFALVALATLAACRTPRPADQGYLADYKRLHLEPEDREVFFTKTWSAAPALPTHVILVSNVTWRDEESGRNAIQRSELCDAFKTQLRTYLLLMLPKGHDVIIVEGERDIALHTRENPRAGVLRLDVAITEARAGSGLARWLIGMGLGKGRVVAECRGRHSILPWDSTYQAVVRADCQGNGYSGMNPRALSDQYVLRFAAAAAAKRLAIRVIEWIQPAVRPAAP